MLFAHSQASRWIYLSIFSCTTVGPIIGEAGLQMEQVEKMTRKFILVEKCKQRHRFYYPTESIISSCLYSSLKCPTR
uniref:Uncharacterized protein n=1 Tax=Nelumbo nucifera TaxID=4432 RepID=A0A822XZP7_NELNU|nr:TPA_asm: hypothetical protein HUJ06_025940 [Nelumbo nucifera]